MTKVLLVDDEPRLIEVLALYLKKKGFIVEIAYGGSEALKLIESFKPQIIFLDIIMPKVNGVEVLDFVNKNYPETTVYMLTAYLEPDIEEILKDKKYKGILAKPVGFAQIEELIKKVIEPRNNGE